jgi:hypothetical protein
MADEPEYKVVQVPMLDTGIGQEAGFANDAELIAHAEAERAKLDPAVRELLDKADAEMTRRFLFGGD